MEVGRKWDKKERRRRGEKEGMKKRESKEREQKKVRAMTQRD